MQRRVLMASCVGCLLALCTAPLGAQSAAPAAPSLRRPDFFTEYRFHLNAQRFATDDPRFVWDADYGGSVDVIDYGLGRLNFFTNHETILGEERHPFDATQGNYTLDFAITLRARSSEVAWVFHHVSRHLGDREKDFPIDWNMAGVRFAQALRAGRVRIDAAAYLFGTTKRSFVDYRSEAGGDVDVRYDVNQRLALIGAGGFTARQVERTVSTRGTQTGGRVEGGVRLAGQRAAVELFLAVERRIDADAIKREPRVWALAGFRVVNR